MSLLSRVAHSPPMYAKRHRFPMNTGRSRPLMRTENGGYDGMPYVSLVRDFFYELIFVCVEV